MSEPNTKPPRSKDPSITDVAQLAGVSVGTVSNVLNRPERVNPQMRARVLEAIEQLGFQRNHVARSLRARRTMTLGLVLSDVTTPFASALARVVQSEAAAAGYTVVFADNAEDIEREQDAVLGLYRYAVDGIILAPSPGDQSYLGELIEKGWPVVAVNRRVQGASVPAVLTDHYGGAVQATEHLLGHGARRIGVVTRSPDISSISDRHAGYEDALSSAGIPFDPELVVEDEPTVEGGRRAALSLLKVPAHKRPAAVMSFSTAMTLGCIIAFRELELTVPRDLRFLAFDDAVWSVAVEPPLTSVALRARHVGVEATHRLIEWIRSGTRPEEELVIPTNLIVRGSCGCGQGGAS